jgi:hypothetical protein
LSSFSKRFFGGFEPFQRVAGRKKLFSKKNAFVKFLRPSRPATWDETPAIPAAPAFATKQAR